MNETKEKEDWARGLFILTVICVFLYLAFFTGISKFKNEVIGKAVEEACTEDWRCEEWSGCADGLKFRTCTDANDCFTEIKKPDEINICSDGEFVAKLGMGYRFEENMGVTLIQVTLVAAIVLIFSSLAFTLIAKEISSRKHEEEKRKEKIDDLTLIRLANYIQRELNCGYTKGQIMGKLTLEGWNKKSIDYAFSKIKISKKESVLLENNWKMDLAKKIDEEFKSYR